MKKFYKTLMADAIGVWSFWLTNSIFIIILVCIGVFFRLLPPYLPLYNHMPWGYARLGTRLEVFVPFLTALLLTILNTFLAVTFREKNPLLSRFLFFANFSLSIFTIIFFFRLTQIIL